MVGAMPTMVEHNNVCSSTELFPDMYEPATKKTHTPTGPGTYKKKRCQPDIIQDRRVIPQPSHNSHYQVPGTRYSGACDLPDHVGLENINIITKPTNSPTEGQPSPRKSRLKVAFGPLFPTTNIFSWVGIDIYVGNTLQETQPNKKINANTILPFLLFI